MKSILVQDITNGEFNYSSFPAIAWGEFGGVYDDYVDAVGIGSDNNINVYVKDCKGYVLPIKEIIEDEDSNKIVFVVEEECING